MSVHFGRIMRQPEHRRSEDLGTYVVAYGQTPLDMAKQQTKYIGTVEENILTVTIIGAKGNGEAKVPLASASRWKRWLNGLFGKQPFALSLSAAPGDRTERQRLQDELRADVLAIRQFLEENPPAGGFKAPHREPARRELGISDPAHPLNPANPANPASPLNPLNPINPGSPFSLWH